MQVTEVKVKLVSDKADKLKAFCTVTIDGEFVIRDIKVIKGTRGYFVAMPSRKLMDRCPSCGGKNHLRATYCNECGGSLRADRVPHDHDGRAKLHADIAHPINQGCRDRLQDGIIEAYEQEVERSKQPGYVPVSDDDFFDDDYTPAEPRPRVSRSIQSGRAGVGEPAEPLHPAPAVVPEAEPSADSFGQGIL
jgi:stage V sporulation protein G